MSILTAFAGRTTLAPMTEIWFYHLEHGSLDAVLPNLLQKTLEKGWRALVRAGTEERLTALDAHLWTFRDDSFLPHGTSTMPHAEDQPILLTVDAPRRNAPQALFIVDGGAFPELTNDDFNGVERCLVIFNGQDGQALQEARGMWKQAKDKDLNISYWQQNPGGGWKKKA